MRYFERPLLSGATEDRAALSGPRGEAEASLGWVVRQALSRPTSQMPMARRIRELAAAFGGGQDAAGDEHLIRRVASCLYDSLRSDHGTSVARAPVFGETVLV
jgi:hypothetical protein